MSEIEIAHVLKNQEGAWEKPHLLIDHLNGTAEISERFAAQFQSADWGRAVGLLHDFGKARSQWQQYLCNKSGYSAEYDAEAHLEGKPGKIPHAIYGAKIAEELLGKGFGRLLSYCISGHHAGLPDWSSSEGSGQSSLQYQILQVKNFEEIPHDYLEMIQKNKPTSIPWKFNHGLDCSLWIRMLYSCLVDADFLDTEGYMNHDNSILRANFCNMHELRSRFNLSMDQLEHHSEKSEINRIRNSILQKCMTRAEDDQGVFALSVPTGGGKTLSSLAFAIHHAIKHDLKRIIYVIPFTSIIEQNADVLRGAVGEDQVVEHHSNISEDDTTPQLRLASENWDAPITVTTSVQFFESLFSSKPSRCRKLHNIAQSVVILDEAQLVPTEFLEPILQTMQLLVDHYHVSFVISTATKPAFHKHTTGDRVFPGLTQIKEIIGDAQEVNKLYRSLKRCEVIMPDDFDQASSLEDIAEELKQYQQVLCILSDRTSCRELYDLMPEGTYHLSALMCGQHRSEKIQEIRKALQCGEPIRVISTQLIEAGVDVDFPVVYRAMAGADSIAQAAGRCNREGKLPDKGEVVVFLPPRRPPLGILRKAADTTRSLYHKTNFDLTNIEDFDRYFTELYGKANSLDSYGISTLLDPMKNDPSELSIFFRTASSRFSIIDDSKQKSIIVRYGASSGLIDQLGRTGPNRSLMRQLQRYTVNIYLNQFTELLKRGDIEEVHPNIFALSTEMLYSKFTGLLVNGLPFDPEQFIQ